MNIFLPQMYAVDVMKAADDISLEDAKDVYVEIPDDLKNEVKELLIQYGYSDVVKE